MKRYKLAIFAMFLFLIGCESTVYRLLYNSLDSLIYRSVTRYITLNPDQDRFIRQRIDSHFRWHRKVELPKYITTLNGLRERMTNGLDESDMAWLRSCLERHGVDFYSVIADDVAVFLVSLDGKQIDQLERTTGERMAEMEKKSDQSEEDRLHEEERSTIMVMEFIYGPLTQHQKDEIASGLRQIENIEPVSMRLYRERREEFFALLREKPDAGRVKDYITRLVINPERSYPDYYREPAKRRSSKMTEGYLRFERELVTPEQRTHALKKIDMLIQVLRELSAG
jgi:hypothetical protein